VATRERTPEPIQQPLQRLEEVELRRQIGRGEPSTNHRSPFAISACERDASSGGSNDLFAVTISSSLVSHGSLKTQRQASSQFVRSHQKARTAVKIERRLMASAANAKFVSGRSPSKNG
jgi:hypothetical protein